MAGCSPRTLSVHSEAPLSPSVASDILASGVFHRAIPTTDGEGIDLVDIDLTASQAKLTLQTHGITLSQGHVVGQAYTPHEWLTRMNALMAVNGGYFGGDDPQGRKEIVGLLVSGGHVRHAAPPLVGFGSTTIRRGQYVRSAFGLTANGTPQITWAATVPGHPQSLVAYSNPMDRKYRSWHVTQAVGCGPTLISDGKVIVTQYQERLVSPGPEPRTFVAYDGAPGAPVHLVIGIASGSDFHALAAFLAAYFPHYDRTRAVAAMCLDGGASTQMSYRFNGSVQSPRETGMTVPDALVLH